MSKHKEPGRRALVKEFYTNLGDRKNLTCYVKGRWVPFGERAISQLLVIRPVEDYWPKQTTTRLSKPLHLGFVNIPGEDSYLCLGEALFS